MWLQAKVVARTAEHQGPVAHLPLSAVEHFACLPADVKAMLRQRAAQHAESRRAKLLKKEAHHRDAAAHLQAKAHKLLAKAAHQQEIAAMKHAKLQEPENKNKDEIEKNVTVATDDDAAQWARVPAHVKARIVSRWCPERAADVDAPSVFSSLPAFVRDRVRLHAGRRERNEDDDGEESAERRRRCREEHREQHRRPGHGGGGRHCWWRAQQQQHQPQQAMPAATAVMPVMPPHAGAAFENAPRADMVPQPPTM